MNSRYLPYDLKSKPHEKIDPDDEEQTELHDFEIDNEKRDNAND